MRVTLSVVLFSILALASSMPMSELEELKKNMRCAEKRQLNQALQPLATELKGEMEQLMNSRPGNTVPCSQVKDAVLGCISQNPDFRTGMSALKTFLLGEGGMCAGPAKCPVVNDADVGSVMGIKEYFQRLEAGPDAICDNCLSCLKSAESMGTKQAAPEPPKTKEEEHALFMQELAKCPQYAAIDKPTSDACTQQYNALKTKFMPRLVQQARSFRPTNVVQPNPAVINNNIMNG